MKYKLIQNLNNQQYQKLKEIYEYSFPSEEKKPFEMIEKLAEADKSQIFGIVDSEGSLLGLLITIEGENLQLIDYFAIDSDSRGQSIGSAALELFKKIDSSRKILLEIEEPDEAEISPYEKGIRLARKRFYHHAGFTLMPYTITLFGVQMKILSVNGEVSFDEYKNLLHQALSFNLDPYVLLKEEV